MRGTNRTSANRASRRPCRCATKRLVGAQTVPRMAGRRASQPGARPGHHDGLLPDSADSATRTCCTGRSEEADHILPVADGGTDDPENLREVCRHCYRARTARDAAAASEITENPRTPPPRPPKKKPALRRTAPHSILTGPGEALDGDARPSAGRETADLGFAALGDELLGSDLPKRALPGVPKWEPDAFALSSTCTDKVVSLRRCKRVRT